MYKFLGFLILILISPWLAAEEKQSPAATPKPEFTEEQLNKLKTAEEQFKDNPEMMNFIQKIKDQVGLNEAPEPEPEPPPPPVKGPSIEELREQYSTRSVEFPALSPAERAYKNRDYATSIDLYKERAAQGDAEASLRLGAMYEMGQGVEKDPAAAQAWYRRAAETGDSRGKLFIRSIESTTLPEEDLEKADEIYKEINEEMATLAGEDPAAQTGAETGDRPGIAFEVRRDSGTTPPDIIRYETAPGGEARFAPEKYPSLSHPKPAMDTTDRFQPERYRRPAATTSPADG